MKITTITVGLSRTVSLPGYENVKPSISFTAEIQADDKLAKAIDGLNIQCLLYVNDQIDDALEAAGQSPRFYCGTLYTAHRWEQAHAIVVLTEGVDLDQLPGDWHAITGSPVRKPSAMDRARQAAKKLNWDLWDWSARGAEKALEWWAARTWYVAYHLDRWLNYHEHEPSQIVVIPAAAECRDWNLSGLMRIRDDDLSNLSYRPRQLEEILKLIPPLPWIVADTEDKLRTIVADWQADNQRPDRPGTAGPQSGPIDEDATASYDDPDDDDERDYDPDEAPALSR
jgi:hypothetical protein